MMQKITPLLFLLEYSEDNDEQFQCMQHYDITEVWKFHFVQIIVFKFPRIGTSFVSLSQNENILVLARLVVVLSPGRN